MGNDPYNRTIEIRPEGEDGPAVRVNAREFIERVTTEAIATIRSGNEIMEDGTIARHNPAPVVLLP